jgi:N-acetylneuraminate synthase
VIISTGMAEKWEISRAVSVCVAAGCSDITLLKCTSAYPATAADANLRAMIELGGGGHLFGLSDHTTGTAVAVAATAHGADVIEKHLTLLRSDGGPDAGFSVEPDEMKRLVTDCRAAAESMGYGWGATENERPSLYYRRAVYAAVDIPVGKTIESGDIRTLRPFPKGAICASNFRDVVGRKAMRAIAAGNHLNINDIA